MYNGITKPKYIGKLRKANGSIGKLRKVDRSVRLLNTLGDS